MFLIPYYQAAQIAQPDEVNPATALTWVLDDSIIIAGSAGFQWSVTFISNGSSYTQMTVAGNETTGVGGIIYYGSTAVYLQTHGGWGSDAYRTITLSEPATGTMLTWLKANATPQ